MSRRRAEFDRCIAVEGRARSRSFRDNAATCCARQRPQIVEGIDVLSHRAALLGRQRFAVIDLLAINVANAM
jgi:hypothetical protein